MLNRTRKTNVQLCGGALLLALASAGCGSQHDPSGAGESVGEVALTLTNVPANVSCIRLTVTGSRTVVRLISVSPGNTTVFLEKGLPLGSDTFLEEAFSSACSSVNAGTIPTWISDPVTATLGLGVVTQVSLVLHPNGEAVVGGDFQNDPEGGTTTVSGACIVRDAFTNMPAFSAPDVGMGYAKQSVPGVDDIAGLQAACTSAVYQTLLGEHCGSQGTPVQAEVVTYNPDGSVNSTTCGTIGCNNLTCPLSGVCIVRDATTSLPAFSAPDVGMGYAKQSVPGVNDIAGLQAACTSTIYQTLLGEHCASQTTPVQAEVATYNPDGTPNSTTCGTIGCNNLTCM